ncbi:MAG: hypothetical protein AAGB13_17915 [Cyanobacteria bacterium P01_F01_bin.33]
MSVNLLASVLGAIAISIASQGVRAEVVPADFERLRQSLESYGFAVRVEAPPLRGAFGLLEASSKTIWINPVVFELGNAEVTLIHEAVHAAQACAGRGTLSPLGLEIPPPTMTRRYFLRYHNLRRQLEAEAYTVPAQPNAIVLVLDLLRKHCAPLS